MGQIMQFPFDDTDVTTVDQGGTPLFVANDVAKALGYRDFRHAVRTYCRYTRVSDVEVPDHRGQMQRPALIPESDVFRLIARSKLPSADRFMDWVCEDVLPAIRQQGHYAHKGSRLDTMMQRRTIGYRSLWKAYGVDRPPMSDLTQRVMRGFNKMAKDAGLPDQFEGVKPDPEIYLMTPALARNLIESYYGGKENGGRQAARALRWLEDQVETTQITNQ